MFLDRVRVMWVLKFILSAIPSGSDTGKNCVFARVDEGKMIFISEGSSVMKKAVMQQGTSSKTGDELPETFMITKSALLAFKKMVEEDKADCKKLPETNPDYLFVEITDKKLTSIGKDIDFKQPDFKFKDLEPFFQITKEHNSEICIMADDMKTALDGFQSDPIETTFTGKGGPIHFEQKEYGLEAVMVPPVKVEQISIDDHVQA